MKFRRLPWEAVPKSRLNFKTFYKMIKIAQTREEKRENILYWEKMRNIAQQIRDEYDDVAENAYHNKFIEKLKSNERPDFMEPLPIKNIKTKIIAKLYS